MTSSPLAMRVISSAATQTVGLVDQRGADHGLYRKLYGLAEFTIEPGLIERDQVQRQIPAGAACNASIMPGFIVTPVEFSSRKA